MAAPQSLMQSPVIEIPGLRAAGVRRALVRGGLEVSSPQGADTGAETYTYYDSWNCSLARRRSKRLRYAQRLRRWQLLEGERELGSWEARAGSHRPDGELAGRLAEITPLAVSVPFVVASRTRRTLLLRTPSGEQSALLEEWSFHSPFRPGATATRTVLLAGGESSGIVELLRGRLGAREASGDHFELAVAALELELPGSRAARRLRVAAGDSVAAAAGKIVELQTHRLRTGTPGAIGDYDPEFVHDMRVAARTLRHALRLLRSVLPPVATAVREELRWLAARLGAVRDLDVFLERLERGLDSLSAEPQLVRLLGARAHEDRRLAFQELSAALRSDRYASLLGSLQALAAELERTPARRRGGRRGIARELEAEMERIAERHGRSAASFTPEDLHELRIRFRRLRYSCELLWPLYGKEMRRLASRFALIQARLGEHRDAWASIASLRGLAVSGPRPEGAGVAPELIEALAAHEESVMVASRSAFRRLWPAFPELRRALERCLEE